MSNQNEAILSPVFAEKYQTVKDFGQSACWWAPVIGGSDAGRDLLRLFHTKSGLDLNVIRLNVGGSVKTDRSDAPYPQDSLLMRAPLSPLSEDGNYDITRDRGMLALAHDALRIGTIDDFTLFMNSPPSTMTRNGLTCGDEPKQEGEYVSNLREDCFEAYADYVANVTQLFIEDGIPVKYVSPINEPQWQWDRRNCQEGCHYTPEEALRFFRLVVKVFAERAKICPAMAKVKISLPETAQWYWPKPYVFGFYEEICKDPELMAHIDHFAAHSYGTNADNKKEFRAFVDSLGAPLPLHQTEWGPLHTDFKHPMEFALELANVMYEDLTILNVPHWTWWTGLAGFSYPSGLIDGNKDGSGLVLTKRYYVMMHHSRFIRGLTRIGLNVEGAEGVVASAYTDADEQRTAIIVINNNPCSVQIKVHASGLTDGKLYLTSADYDCTYMGTCMPEEEMTLPGYSVATLAFGGIQLEEEGAK